MYISWSRSGWSCHDEGLENCYKLIIILSARVICWRKSKEKTEMHFC